MDYGIKTQELHKKIFKYSITKLQTTEAIYNNGKKWSKLRDDAD
jgi:hypothetical protein